MIEPTDTPNHPWQVGDCYIYGDTNGLGYRKVTCPVLPQDDPEGPSYLTGLKGLSDGESLLLNACIRKGCCSNEQCKREAATISWRLMYAWQNNYGKGCYSSVGDPVGGFFCWDWSKIFLQAISQANLQCFVGTEWAARPKQPNSLAVHYYLWVSADRDFNIDYSVMFDDGYMGGYRTANPGWKWDKWVPVDPATVPPAHPLCPFVHLTF